jgi:hypothetical protein
MATFIGICLGHLLSLPENERASPPLRKKQQGGRFPANHAEREYLKRGFLSLFWVD